MDQLQLREKEIFAALRAVGKSEFVIIGGYAASSYAPPRFSVDCDIVVKDKETARGISSILRQVGYNQVSAGTAEAAYGGSFERFEKELPNGFIASVDMLVGAVTDRGTLAVFSAGWVFENSIVRNLRGKTIAEQLPLRILKPDALFAMKAVSCRPTDIRDVFMLAPSVEGSEWVVREIAKRCNLQEKSDRILKTVDSRQFRDGLQGVYGKLDSHTFDNHMKALKEVFSLLS